VVEEKGHLYLDSVLKLNVLLAGKLVGGLVVKFPICIDASLQCEVKCVKNSKCRTNKNYNLHPFLTKSAFVHGRRRLGLVTIVKE